MDKKRLQREDEHFLTPQQEGDYFASCSDGRKGVTL